MNLRAGLILLGLGASLLCDLVGFTSPSGNVGCFIDSANVRCDISERDWSPPPRPADCQFY